MCSRSVPLKWLKGPRYTFFVASSALTYMYHRVRVIPNTTQYARTRYQYKAACSMYDTRHVYIIYACKALVLRVGKFFTSSHGSLLVLSAAGHAGGLRVHCAAVQIWVPAGLRGACSERSRSREQAPARRVVTPSRAGPWKPHHCSDSVFWCYVSRRPPSISQTLHFIAANAVQQQQQSHTKLFPVTATDGASVLVRVRHVSCRPMK